MTSGKRWCVSRIRCSLSCMPTLIVLQGWKGSVKARHLVMSLHDFYVDVHQKIKMQNERQTGDQFLSVPSPTIPSFHLEDDGVSIRSQSVTSDNDTERNVEEDAWALAYINVTRVQPYDGF